MIEHIVPQTVPAMPLDRYLRRAWPLLPSHALRELEKRRDVKRDGKRIGAKDAVRGGDRLAIYLPDALLLPDAELLYRDDRLAAVYKPQGLPVDADQDGVGADTLRNRLLRVFPDARLLHRLDAAAGGVVLVALDEETERQGRLTFQRHALSKRYLAVAKGGFDFAEAVERAYLVKDAKRAAVRVTSRPSPSAKPIETRVELVDETDGLARLYLEPVTGRTHQLRAHLAFLGHPLLGDDLYGDRALNAAHPGRLRLFCQSMTLAKDAPLEAYRGRTFQTNIPEWWKIDKYT